MSAISPIANVEVLPISAPGEKSWDCDATVDTVVVRITDEDGRVGIGEADAPPGVVKAFVEMPSAHIWSLNMTRLLVGADPLEVAALWQRLYEGTQFPGRRGLGVHALSAIDIALYDLAGRQIDQPVYKLMGGARREKLTPYATIFPGMPNGRTIRQLMERIGEQFETAVRLGFRAVKMEVLFDDLVNDRELADLIREGRRMLGDDITMMVDFGYRWRDWHAAKWVLDRIEDCDIYLAEAPLQHDDLLGHARLAESTGIRIGGAEFAATRWEVREWIEIGKVAVIQIAVGRGGGFTEMRRITDMAELYGVQVVPHGWKTGITDACGRHIQAACPNVPFFEYISPDLFDSVLRRELVSPEPTVRDGFLDLPDAPGLGVELNPKAVERYLVT